MFCDLKPSSMKFQAEQFSGNNTGGKMKIGAFASLMALAVTSVSFSAFADGPNMYVGEQVVYTQSGTHYDAVIQQIYSDSTAQISFPNGEFTVSQVPVSALSIHLKYEAGFKVGEPVVYLQSGTHYDAIIQELYTDSIAQITFPNGEFAASQVTIASLSEHLSIEGGLQVGQAVIYVQSGTHYHATVLELYTDGTAKISFPNGEFTISQVPVSALSVALSSEAGFSVGEAVIYVQNGTHYNAVINELYQDGTALVQFPNGEFTASQVPLAALSVALACTQNCGQ
jgi:hypothetical protein